MATFDQAKKYLEGEFPVDDAGENSMLVTVTNPTGEVNIFTVVVGANDYKIYDPNSILMATFNDIGEVRSYLERYGKFPAA